MCPNKETFDYLSHCKHIIIALSLWYYRDSVPRLWPIVYLSSPLGWVYCLEHWHLVKWGCVCRCLSPPPSWLILQWNHPSKPGGQYLKRWYWIWFWSILMIMDHSSHRSGEIFLLNYIIDFLSIIFISFIIKCKDWPHNGSARIQFLAMMASNGSLVESSSCGSFGTYIYVT